MFSNLFQLTSKFPYRLNVLFIITIALTIFASFLETIGLGSIPIFISLIADPELLANKLDFIDLNNFLNSYNKVTISIYASTFLTFIFFTKNLIILFTTYIQLKFTKSVTVFLGSTLFRNYINLDYEALSKKNSSELTRNLVSEVTQANAFFNSVLKILRDSFLFIFIFTFLLVFDPYISLIVFFVIGSSVCIIVLLTKNPIKKLSLISLKMRSKWFQAISEGLKSAKYVKVTFKHNTIFAELEKNLTQVENYRLKAKFLTNVPKLLIEIVGISTLLTISLGFYYLNLDPALLLASLAVTGIALVRLLPTFNTLANEIANLSSQAPSVELINRDLSTSISSEYLKKKNSSVLVFKDKIIFDNVSYKYPDSKDNILQGINFSINKGEHIGVMGDSGSGKTTLVDLLLGLIPPTNGSILIDGKNIQTARVNFSYALQESFVFDSSIKDNIIFGAEFNESKFNAISEKVQLSNFINEINHDINSRLGESGAMISGGQKQRIGLARALYSDPDILIIDEGTNALDMATENKVITGIHELMANKTLIFISHNKEALSKCSKILMVKNNIVSVEKNLQR